MTIGTFTAFTKSKLTKTESKVNGLQLLRGLACSIVVFHHFSDIFRTYSTHYSFIVLSGLGNLGRAGVDIFFVLSGFIMLYAYDEKFRKKPDSNYELSKDFIIKRIKRVMPIYWIWTIALLILWKLSIALTSQHFSASYIGASFLLLPAKSPDNVIHPILAQGWTLTFEMYFYLVFAISLFAGLKNHIFIGICLLFLIGAAMGWIFNIGPDFKYLVDNNLLFEFIFGILAYYLFKSSLFITYRRYSALLTLVGFLALLGTTFIIFDGNYRFIFYGVPALFILCGVLGFNRKKATVASSFFLFLGNASYSIYLTHGFIVLIAAKYLKNHTAKIQGDIFILLLTALTILLCSVTYIVVEQPINVFLNRRKQTANAEVKVI